MGATASRVGSGLADIECAAEELTMTVTEAVEEAALQEASIALAKVEKGSSDRARLLGKTVS